MSSPLVYIAGPYDKFLGWCDDNCIDAGSPMLSYLGDRRENFSTINIPREGVAVVNLGDAELVHALLMRMRDHNWQRVHYA